MIKSLLAGALALVPISSQATLPPPTFIATDHIELISCAEGKGTGFKLASGAWVSVRHVTRLTDCRVDGRRIFETYHDDLGDFSTFIVPGDNRKGGYEIDCAGYRDRQWYWGEGHARGEPIVQVVPVLYSAIMTMFDGRRGWATMLYNRFIRGMSGGPVRGRDGRVAGVVNAYAVEGVASFSQELRDTPLCAA